MEDDKTKKARLAHKKHNELRTNLWPVGTSTDEAEIAKYLPKIEALRKVHGSKRAGILAAIDMAYAAIPEK